MRGAGDTYFSGKMLSKLARILVLANEIGSVEQTDFDNALGRLRSGVEIWLNGSAESPLLYDKNWGGLVMCGCTMNEEEKCANVFPNCPALLDQNSNFGAGFYNDHHFHYGYHIYAAAVVSKFDPAWGRKFHERVLVLVRDIVNPSADDPYFPAWRHKDWYLGFSWASGIVTISGTPNPNGRNEESSSESIAAYEAVALYGAVMTGIYSGNKDTKGMKYYENAVHLKTIGRVLLSTEISVSKTYWHVQAKRQGVARVYPDIYTPKVVGMMWSMMAQQQTWFGNQPWKSYGIQILPITSASEFRDNPEWVQEMLPIFEESCSADKVCGAQGWSILVYAAQAEIGEWEKAWRNLDKLEDLVYETPGGNGHSR
jgi:endo-1,3(4)-beta-glucanase